MEPAHAQLDEPVNALHRHDGPDVGVGVGLLLLKGATELGGGTTDRTVWRDDPESEAAGVLVLAGFAAIAAGGPIGTVEGAGIERGRWDAYAGAGFGEFVAGVLGYALAGQLHDKTPFRLVGLGTGMAVGSTAGAIWVASAQAEDEGIFNYRKGRWRMSTPRCAGASASHDQPVAVDGRDGADRAILAVGADGEGNFTPTLSSQNPRTSACAASLRPVVDASLYRFPTSPDGAVRHPRSSYPSRSRRRRPGLVGRPGYFRAQH